MNHEFHKLHELNNEQRFEDLKDFEPTDDKDYTILNYEFHKLHELNNEQRFEDLKDFEPTGTPKKRCVRDLCDYF